MVNQRHRLRRNCTCDSCHAFCKRGCKNPHKCSKAVREYLRKLPWKWNPEFGEDSREMSQEEETNSRIKGRAIFNLDIMMRGSLNKGFWVFITEATGQNDNINYSRKDVENPSWVTTYTDESYVQNNEGKATAEASIWFEVNDIRNLSLKLAEDMA